MDPVQRGPGGKAADLVIRPERPADGPAVESLVRDAFGSEAEAALVRRLRTEAGVVSLVAEEAGVVVGHILFSPVTVTGGEGPAAKGAVGLAPMAVLPERQRRGVGGALIRAGLAACAEQDVAVVFVLGHPAYYPRFGFVPAAACGLHYGDGSRDAAFFLRELKAGAAAALRGRVAFHPAFDGL